jgi:hypothetical protein
MRSGGRTRSIGTGRAEQAAVQEEDFPGNEFLSQVGRRPRGDRPFGRRVRRRRRSYYGAIQGTIVGGSHDGCGLAIGRKRSSEHGRVNRPEHRGE